MLTESRKLLRIMLLLAGLSVLPGCGSLYLLQAARGQAQILADRRPIPRWWRIRRRLPPCATP
jgi:hypothetical protein